ncbi:MAG: diguanylate cyclase domain-containing protein [Cellvibrionaceae bacterium]
MDNHNYRSMLENIDDAVLVHDEGIPLFYNQPYLSLLGFDSAEEYETSIEVGGVFGQLHSDDYDRVRSSHNQRMDGTDRSIKYYSARLKNKEGHYRWIDLKVCSIDWSGKHVAMVCLQDSNQLINRSNSNTHFQSLFSQMLGSIPAVITLTTIEDGIYLHVSDMFETAMGYSKKSIIGRSSHDLKIWPYEEERQHLVDCLSAGKALEDFNCSVYTRNGDIIPVSIWARIIECEPENIIMMVGFDRSDDVSKLKHIQTLNENLKLMATTDSMTGLHNRRHLIDASKPLLSMNKRQSQSLSTLICDIDKFKNINDSYGHDIGDAAIIAFANTISACTRNEDLVARWGGEEFVIVLSSTDLEQAAALAERIRQKTEQIKLRIDGHEVCFTASFGLAIMPTDSEDIEEGIKLADQALYQAKQSGRNRVVAFQH